MSSFKRIAAVAALLSSASVVTAVGTSGSGTTTRYWDCCKPSCAWTVSGITSPVKTCDIHDKPLADGVTAQSGCQGGTSYMCSDQSPWEISADLAYGFAAVTASNPTCCSCYKLTFTSTAIKGKTMIVQATNTGNDVSGTQFDLAIPGGGFGQFDGCSKEWGATSNVWGQQYGGSSTNTCPQFPTALQPGCQFRWGWMQGADNPTVDYESITCPAEIVAKSGCSVSGYSPPSNPVPSSSSSSVIKPPLTTTTKTTPPATTPTITTKTTSSLKVTTTAQASTIITTTSSLPLSAPESTAADDSSVISGPATTAGEGVATGMGSAAPTETGTETGGEDEGTCEL